MSDIFEIRSDKKLNQKTKWIRISLSVAFIIISLYSSYNIWWKEKTIETALQTPEGIKALAQQMVDAEKERSFKNKTNP